MSGHSKWSTIKHKKGVKDAQKGALFTKLAKNITIAAHEGGGDIEMNFALRLAIDKAKQANMPKDNIERAIKKGTGELEGEQLSRVSYEAYGSAGVAMIIDCTTDNTNRTVSEVKRTLEANGGKMADPGSVAWQFEEKGLIVISPQKAQESEKFGKEAEYIDVDPEEVILEVMEMDGVLDLQEVDGSVEIFCEKTSLQQLDNAIKEAKYKIEASELIKVAKDELDTPENVKEKTLRIVEELENLDDVDSVWTNVKM
ncbi:YebC/PmpR family DNA-binding transcriptional regulator [Candidatus Dojkabacteria bacterium]|nr:YebC/PmpR family DNA-binding transcriptional regulator [Candidatus Dojkabacteria bacterium]